MSAPRLEINLSHLHHNARTLVRRLARQGIAVTGVSKAVLGMPEIVRTWLAAGLGSIGESRLDTAEALARGGLQAPLLMIRTPMLSQVARVVAHAAISCNTEPRVLEALAVAARKQGRRHGVLLMVELGDLREGILPGDLERIAQLTLALPSLQLVGIGSNLGCQHGVAPDAANMAELSELAETLEARLSTRLQLISGGNSANLPWLAQGGAPGRINHLRLGEALLLGREPLGRSAIPGLHTNAFRLVGEVIEVKTKPGLAWGSRGLTSFMAPGGPAGLPCHDRDPRQRGLLALGVQDSDPAGLEPPPGVAIVGASSDHLVLESLHPLTVGEEVGFGPSYSALLRAMTSPFVERRCLREATAPHHQDAPG
ncbi:amino acid racemase [Cyanobium sp. PCC 7001]|uniref:alanine/ornithine racemase family PLP-dependent enzyme n=1 Tax=Cyanobium sp. PCC 7001 TaxID=180281 RepID=UPI0001805990|nr:alanine/ornithine racemase family PLP-dependent enzyme [Cyanobium sp. PCC 7001]EDY37678.1 amino acid racemase [Cyanobium sp. PCC 7001]